MYLWQAIALVRFSISDMNVHAFPPHSPHHASHMPALVPTLAVPMKSPLDLKSVLMVQSYKASMRHYVPMSQRDIHAMGAFAPITVGYRLSSCLDSQLLCRSLLRTCVNFPATMGRLVTLNGQYFVETPCHDVTIRTVEVSAQALTSRIAWQEVFDTFPLRANNIVGEKFLQVCTAPAEATHTGCPGRRVFER